MCGTVSAFGTQGGRELWREEVLCYVVAVSDPFRVETVVRRAKKNPRVYGKGNAWFLDLCVLIL